MERRGAHISQIPPLAQPKRPQINVTIRSITKNTGWRILAGYADCYAQFGAYAGPNFPELLAVEVMDARGLSK